MYIMDFVHFQELFHISNKQINFSPSGKMKGLTNTQDAGQPHFADIAPLGQCLRGSDQEFARSSAGERQKKKKKASLQRL